MSLTWSTLLSFSLSKWASVSRSICFESSLATQIKCNQCPNVPASPRFTSSQAAHSPGAFHWIDKKKVVSARHILGMSGARALTHNSEGRTLTHIPVPETNTLKQGEAWTREETAGNDYLGLRCSFLDMCRKIWPGSILFTSFDDNQFT